MPNVTKTKLNKGALIALLFSYLLDVPVFYLLNGILRLLFQ